MFASALMLLVAPVAAAPKLPKPKLICRVQEVTGSLAGTKRVCMTADDWARQHTATQQALNTMNEHTTSCAREDNCQ